MDEPNLRPTDDDLADLFEPGTANQPIPYLLRMLDLREYLWADAKGSVESQYADTSLGGVWLYLEPLLDMFTWFLIFGVGLRAGREIPGEEVNFFVFLAVGMTAYNLMRGMFGGAMGALGRIRAIPFDFPRGVAVLIGYARQIYDYRFHVAILLLLITLSGVRPRLSWLLLIPLALLASTLGAGIGFFLARVGASRPTAIRFVNKIMQFLYWTAGIMIPVEGYILQAPNGEMWLRIYTIANPLYATVKLHQWAAFGYQAPSAEIGIWSAPVWAVVLLVSGFIWMVRGEALYRQDGLRLG